MLKSTFRETSYPLHLVSRQHRTVLLLPPIHREWTSFSPSREILVGFPFPLDTISFPFKALHNYPQNYCSTALAWISVSLNFISIISQHMFCIKAVYVEGTIQNKEVEGCRIWTEVTRSTVHRNHPLDLMGSIEPESKPSFRKWNVRE